MSDRIYIKKMAVSHIHKCYSPLWHHKEFGPTLYERCCFWLNTHFLNTVVQSRRHYRASSNVLVFRGSVLFPLAVIGRYLFPWPMLLISQPLLWKYGVRCHRAEADSRKVIFSPSVMTHPGTSSGGMRLLNCCTVIESEALRHKRAKGGQRYEDKHIER